MTESSDPATTARSPHLAKAAFACAAISLVALSIAIVWTSAHRGPWYDEFYTQWVTRPDRDLADSMRESWLFDNHPPLYYLLSWLTGWLGPIEMHRLLNLGLLVATIATGWGIVRNIRALHMAAVALAMLLVANMWTVQEASELRSYFLSLCTGAMLPLALCATWLEGNTGDRLRRIATLLTAIAAFNNHIITTIVSGALVIPFAVCALLRRDRALFLAIMRAPFVAGLMFCALAAIQFPYWMQNTQSFWITGGFDSASWSIQYAIQRTLEANPIMTFVALAGVGSWLWSAWSRRRMEPGLEAGLMLASGGALAIGILIGLHLLRPMIIEKYLMALVGALAVGLALAFARAMRSFPVALGMSLLASCLAMTLYQLQEHSQTIAQKNSWYGTARLVARITRDCPQTVVHTDPFWNAKTMAMTPKDNLEVPGFGYRIASQHFGFRTEPSGSMRVSETCPTLFWAEHDTSRLFDANDAFAHIRSRGYPIEQLIQYRVGDGWVASNRPLTAAD